MDIVERIGNVMDNFDFDRVKKVMDALEWGWAVDNPEYSGQTEIPELSDIRKMARKLMKEAYELSVKEGCGYTIATAGFEAYCDAGDDYLSLKFVVTDWDDYDME